MRDRFQPFSQTRRAEVQLPTIEETPSQVLIDEYFAAAQDFSEAEGSHDMEEIFDDLFQRWEKSISDNTKQKGDYQQLKNTPLGRFFKHIDLVVPPAYRKPTTPCRVILYHSYPSVS